MLYMYRPGHDLGDYLPVKASLSLSAVVKVQSNLDLPNFATSQPVVKVILLHF